ncbi:hypothetical protein KSP40_PGU004054 [Platanthera guangdongensis]|uniref:Transposase n=1 Tax=Platanthera guangdongensis TaxID=2320717 RepID=A0ABR2M5W1_9ASPA
MGWTRPAARHGPKPSQVTQLPTNPCKAPLHRRVVLGVEIHRQVLQYHQFVGESVDWNPIQCRSAVRSWRRRKLETFGFLSNKPNRDRISGADIQRAITNWLTVQGVIAIATNTIAAAALGSKVRPSLPTTQ